MPDMMYILNQRYPTEKAYGIQISKMCEAFSDQGLQVTLVAPYRQNQSAEDPFSYYNVRKNFKFVRLPTADFYFLGPLDRISFLIKSYLSARVLVRYASACQNCVFYSRDESVVSLLLSKKMTCVYEAHKFYSKRELFYLKLKKTSSKIIVITEGLKTEFLKKGFTANRILVSPDGVDLSEFPERSKEEARKQFHLPSDLPIILYAGQLFDWKGVETFLEAKPFLPESRFVIVGGTAFQHQKLKDRSDRENIIFIPQRPRREMPLYMAAADVLVLPNRGDSDLSKAYTSPLKLFEYMASRRPIIASNLPSIREILNDQNAVLIEPDNAKLLAENIKNLIHDKEKMIKLSTQAFIDVTNHTWHQRAVEIINFIQL